MFRAGDVMNPYNPASMAFSSSPEEMIRRMQAQSPMLAAMFNNPDPASREAAWSDYQEYERADAEERERTGETEYEQMMREKREWAEEDAKSAKLKDDGNAAFKDGLRYLLRMHAPLWPGTAVSAEQGRKLKLYDIAIKDASLAIKKIKFNRFKCYYRRAQGNFFLGDWLKADENYVKALALQPGDRNIVHAIEELKSVRSLSAEEQAGWVSEQGKLTLPDVFEPGELERLAEKVLVQCARRPP
ncbi:hypothetical protein C8R44DRAFT_866759 [Mycena epipterygia]|nr:hypothetical protein C8R44DRAFT_866759 [Mycena epipterygia]